MGMWHTIRRRLAVWVGKGLYDLYPDLAQREPLLRMTSDLEGALMTETSFAQSSQQYETHVWVHRAIDVIANNFAALPLTVEANGEVVEGHPVNAILSNPNPAMSAVDLWRQWATQMYLGGECGVEVVWNARGNQMLEWWPRQPQTFAVSLESARYARPAGYTIDDGAGDPYTLLPRQMQHYKFYNPRQPARGLAPITAVRLSIVVDQLAQAWTRLFFKNQARPDYAVVAPQGITPSERRELETQLTQRFGGMGANGAPIILEQGVTDIKVFSWAPKDLEWVQQRQMSRDEIGAVFGVPDEIMGYGRDTYENFATAERVLLTLTIQPLARLRDDTLTMYLRSVKAIKPNEAIVTDFAGIDALREGENDQWSRAQQQITSGAMTINEWRCAAGMEPLTWGDVWWAPATLAPINSPERPATVTALPTRMMKAYGDDGHVLVWVKAQGKVEKHVPAVQKRVRTLMTEQQARVEAALRSGKSFGRGQFKAPGDVPPVEDVFDLEGEIVRWIAGLRPIITAAYGDVGQQALDDLSLQMIFNLDRPEVQRAINGILRGVSEKTNNTTWNQLIDLFTAAEQAGEGIPKIQERLRGYYGDRKADWQTERIARTTMTGASNSGSTEAWRQSGVVARKTWISALAPGRTRDDHAAAHDQTVGLDDTFDVGGEALGYPGDPVGSAANVINCLCTMVPVVE